MLLALHPLTSMSGPACGLFKAAPARGVPPCYGLIISRYRYISIGRLYKDIVIILCSLYIDIVILLAYNKCIIGEVAEFRRALTGGERMAVSKAQQRATAKYEAKVYDKLLLRLPKGKKDIIQAHAEANGQSVNGFINAAIDEKMERDNNGRE